MRFGLYFYLASFFFFFFPFQDYLHSEDLITGGDVDKAKISSACKASILLEALSREVLSEQNPDMKLGPASMVKTMTTYVTLKQIKDGSVGLDDQITISPRASKIGGSQVYLKEKEQFSLRELLQAVLLQSANDAATAMAEYIGGSVEGFVDFMNEEAESLGMKNTTFTTPHGLPPSKGQEPDISTPRDLSILARALIREFPETLETTKLISAGFRNDSMQMRNHNHHLLNSFAGCDGIKTGYYQKAGYGVIATAERRGVRMITVVMGCDSAKIRTEEASRLMTAGFSKYKSIRLAEKGAEIEPPVVVANGDKKEIKLVCREDVRVTIRQGQEKEIKKIVTPCSPLEAPLSKGAACGQVKFLLNDKEIASGALEIPYDIVRVGIMTRLKRLVLKD